MFTVNFLFYDWIWYLVRTLSTAIQTVFSHTPFDSDTITMRDGVYHPPIIRLSLSPCAMRRVPADNLYQLDGDRHPSGGRRTPRATRRRPEFWHQGGIAATNLQPLT
jgi:hypothetical protein